jgi:hypothetical protein
VDHVFSSPFVSRRFDPSGVSVWGFDPQANFNAPDGFFLALSAKLSPGKEVLFNAGNLRFEVLPGSDNLTVPASLVPQDARPLALIGGNIASFHYRYASMPRFPDPIPADPGMILWWPLQNWRDSRYEIFRWDRFPTLLIFDFADFAMQDKMLKRLAFFVEKAGFRGRLAFDREIAGLHGWNAHDYRAESLELFFQTAHDSGFPLLPEELELEKILIDTGIIKRAAGVIQAGEGGILSISRASPDNLRIRFMAHEGFHGLFYIDEDFREFTRRRWQQFHPDGKAFMLAFFSFQQYDIADEYLLHKEFSAHLLQQPVSEARNYFGVILPSRIERVYPNASSRPALGEIFAREAEAFCAYAESRWGFSAGRVSTVRMRQL